MPRVNNAKEKRGPGRPRKKAPEVDIIQEVYKDDRAAIVEEAREALGSDAAGMAFCYRSPRESGDTSKRLGYVPAMKAAKEEGGSREQYSHGGDPLWMRPKEVSDMFRDAPAKLAEMQLDDAETGQGDQYDGLIQE